MLCHILLWLTNVIITTLVFVIQGVHKVLHTFKILISQKPHMVETLDFRQ